MAVRIVEEAGLTDVGRQRTTNEDSYLESTPVFAVADGMGGARAGEVASKIAVETLADSPGASGSPEAHLAGVAQAANRKIYDLAQEDESRSGMGTTLTAVMVTDGDVVAGHVGDSRLYRLRGGQLERLTRDHSLVEELVRQGKLDPAEVDSHPQRSIITRALGPEPEVEVETFTAPGRAGDVYLLCSDGLTGMVAEEDVAEIIRATPSLEAAARRLVGAANDNGGRDNITVVLFRLGGDEAAGDEPGSPSAQETQPALSATEVRSAVAAKDRETVESRRPLPKARSPRRGQLTGRPAGGARRLVTAVLGVAVVAALVVGFYFGSRQFYFVGTSEQGLITLYRGLPYDLFAGIELYEREYTSTVPARSLDERQRDEVLDHQLRGRGDAVDLVRELERVRSES